MKAPCSPTWRTLWLSLSCLLFSLFGSSTAFAQAPAPPTVTSGSYSLVSADATGFLVNWVDNSDNEIRFDAWISDQNNTATAVYWESFGPNTTRGHFYVNSAFFPTGSTLYIWVAAINSGLVTSGFSSVAAVTNTGSIVNNPPSTPTATFPADNTVRLSWADGSNFEEFTEIWARDTGVGGSVAQYLTAIPWNVTQQDLYYFLQPGRTYEVTLRTSRRVGNYNTNNIAYTPFSAPLTVTMPGTYNATPPVAPSNLSVAAFVDTANGNANAFGVYFDDNSTDEVGFEFQDKAQGASDTTFASLGVMNGATGTNRGYGTPISGYAASAAREYRVRALRGNGPFAIPSAFTATSGATLASFNAPTDLRVTAPGNDGKVQLFWSDNATTETGYAIEFRYGTSGAFTTLGTLSTTDFSRYQASGGIGGFDPGESVQFQIRAVGSGSPSGYSNLATVVIPAALDAPVNLTRTVLGENSVKLDWTDNTSNESGFIIQARILPNGTFFDTDVLINSTNEDFNAVSRTRTLTLPNTLLYPGLSYELRVMAAYVPNVGSQINSPFSNVVTADVPFHAPTNLTATVTSESSVDFTWTDNSSVESKFYILARESGATQYSVLATANANATSLTVPNIIPGLTYDFAIIGAYVRAPGDEVETALSNGVTRTLSFASPSALSAVAATDRQINLTWTDASSAESGYIIYCKLSTDSSFVPCGIVDANVTSFSVRFVDAGSNSPLEPNTAYQFEVRAFAGISASLAASNPALVDAVAVRTSATTGSATTKDGVTSDLSPPMAVNEIFSHTFSATQGQASISSSSITGTLPPGITYEPVSRTLSGTPTARGAFTPILTVNWSNGWTSTQTLHLRPYNRPGRPVAATTIANHTMAVGDTPLSIPLGATFADPDAESAVAIALPAADGTPGGRTITIVLNDSVTPITVDNFMDYITDAVNGYAGSVFERLVPGFVLQGGTFRSSTLFGVASNAFDRIRDNPSKIQNEPGLPNIAGTLAMAKQAGDPDSATTAFFFNLADNTANLDYQNEGFSVFGRVTQPSLATLAAVANSPLPPAVANGQPANYQVIAQGNITKPFVVSSNTTVGSTTIVPSSFATSFLVGYAVSGAGIPLNTVITAVNGTTSITISNAATLTGTTSLTFGEPSAFSSMPYNAATAPAPPIDASKLLRINSVTSSVPVLHSHSAISSNTGVVTTSFSGTNLSLAAVGPGTSTISLQVTDLDGNQLLTPLTFTVTVNNTLSNWATTEGLITGQDGPQDDPDFDGRKNLLEYALMTGPKSPGGQSQPSLSTLVDGADNKATITFKVRKFATLTYIVEGSSNLTSWAPVWTSTDGFAAAAVHSATDNADHTLLTVKDSIPYTAGTPRFLRLTVTSP